MVKKRKKLFFVILFLIVVLFLGFFVSSKTGFTILQQNENKISLDELSSEVQAGCLQNSQCSEGFECVANSCIDEKEINLCKEQSLSVSARKLGIGDSINSVVGVVVESDLPYLLPDGELVEIIDGKAVEYLYEQVIFIGDNEIGSENNIYSIKESGKPLYTYKLYFSNGVDFSNKEIQGQALRILGEEYLLGSKSTNSRIELISEKNRIKLQSDENVEITTDERGDVVKIEVFYFPKTEIKEDDNYLDNIFDSIKLSFNYASEDFVDIRVGGNC